MYYYGFDKDEYVVGGLGWDGCKDGGEKDGDEKVEICLYGCEIGFVVFFDIGVGFDKGGDGRGV